MRILFYFLIYTVFSLKVLAFELNHQPQKINATELNQICSNAHKKSSKDSFENVIKNKCIGYISGFLDSLVILEKLTDEKHICIPRSLPKSQISLFLKQWVFKNEKIAPNITGSVALFAALKTTFPCQEEGEEEGQEKDQEKKSQRRKVNR